MRKATFLRPILDEFEKNVHTDFGPVQTGDRNRSSLVAGVDGACAVFEAEDQTIPYVWIEVIHREL